MARTRENSTAVAGFIEKKGEIDTMLGRLQRLSADHFNVDPDRITWGESARSATTPSCSGASPTAPSTRASSPTQATPRRSCPAGTRGSGS